jgi:hypothetical protein
MALGVEVNPLWEKSPADFQTFVTFFDETRVAIRAASPGTEVFTSFQLEKMKGLGGGLFGGVNYTSKAEWGILADFPTADLVGFTTYPGLLFHDQAGIRNGHYAEIGQRTGKPVAFTEVGRQSSGLAGWPTTRSARRVS